MDEKDVQQQIESIMGIDPAMVDHNVGASWVTYKMLEDPDVDPNAFTIEKPRENPPEDPLTDLLTANLASHYIIDRISRADLIQRVTKIWPNAGGLDLSEFLDKLDRDKDEYWKKVRGEKPIGK